MKTEVWLKVEGKKSKYGAGAEPGAISSYKKKPATGAGEIAIKIDLDLPDALFLKPTLTARVEVPDDHPISTEVDATVKDNLAAILEEQLGLRVHISADDKADAL
ncbi:MAG: hypothetical protein AAFR11_03500 [Pseudomonadota bacterium]